jgi:hypothetical protein
MGSNGGNPEDGGSSFHRNVSTYLPNYTVSSSTQKIEATGSAETLVSIYQTTQCHLLPRKWRQQVLPKRWYLSTKLHSVIFYPKNGDNRFCRNVGTYLPNYTVPSSTQKIEATGSAETSVSIYQTIQCHLLPTRWKQQVPPKR